MVLNPILWSQRPRSSSLQKACVPWPDHSSGCRRKHCLLSLPDVECLGQSHDLSVLVTTVPRQLGARKRLWPPTVSHTFRLVPSVVFFLVLFFSCVPFIAEMEVTRGRRVVLRDLVVPAKHAAFGHWACPINPMYSRFCAHGGSRG